MKAKDIPNEVWWVFCLQYHRYPVGIKTYEKCQEIIKKYPEHFPWETKYNKIPKHVHDAYFKEVSGGKNYFIMPEFDESQGKGLYSQIEEDSEKQKANYTGEATIQNIKDLFEALGKNEERREKEKNDRIRIWNKHYKPYRLEYREGY